MKISFAPSQLLPLSSLNSQLEGSVFCTLSKLPGASGCRDHIVSICWPCFWGPSLTPPWWALHLCLVYVSMLSVSVRLFFILFIFYGQQMALSSGVASLRLGSARVAQRKGGVRGGQKYHPHWGILWRVDGWSKVPLQMNPYNRSIYCPAFGLPLY